MVKKGNRALSAHRTRVQEQGNHATPKDRKHQIIASLEQHAGSDRANYVYDKLMADHTGFVKQLDLHNAAELAKAITKKCREIHLPWTKAFAEKKKDDKQDNGCATAQLEPCDWNTVITDQPSDSDSVSLVTEDTLTHWLNKEFLAKRSAIITLGTFSCSGSAHSYEHIKVPLLWKEQGAPKATKIFREATLFQLGTDPVVCKTLATKVDVSTATQLTAFVQMKIFEHHSDGTFKSLFDQQHVPAAMAAPQAKQAVSTKRTYNKNEAKQKLDAALKAALEDILSSLVQDLQLRSPLTKLQRHVNPLGHRMLGATFAADKATIEETLLPHSGTQAITFQYAFATGDDVKHELLWCQDATLRMPQVREMITKFHHAGCIVDMKRGAVGVRIPHDAGDVSQLRLVITGSNMNGSATKYRIDNVPPHLGTKHQLQSILQMPVIGQPWEDMQVQFVQYNRTTKACFAIIKAQTDPPLWNLDLGDQVAQIAKVEAKASTPKAEQVMLTTPAQAPPEPTPAPVVISIYDDDETEIDEDSEEMVDAKPVPKQTVQAQRLPTTSAEVTIATFQAPISGNTTAKSWAAAIKPLCAVAPKGTKDHNASGTSQQATASAQPRTTAPFAPTVSTVKNEATDRMDDLQDQINQLKSGVTAVETQVGGLSQQVAKTNEQQTAMAGSMMNMEQLLQGIALQLQGNQPVAVPPATSASIEVDNEDGTFTPVTARKDPRTTRSSPLAGEAGK